MFQFVEFMAVVVSAVFGILLARRNRMDFVGVFSLACITAFGGGTLRDLFLDRHPLFWINSHQYPLIVFAMAVASFAIRTVPDQLEEWLYVPDALGMGLFSVVGTSVAIDAGTSWFVASLFGVMTGTFGGVMGEVVCNQVPSLFRPAVPLYATASFVGSWVFLLFQMAGMSSDIATIVAIVVIVTIRLLALRWNICLPSLAQDHGPDSMATRNSENESR